MLRRATIDDIPALLELERESFHGDRLGRRQFRHLLGPGANARTMVLVNGARILGYVMLLFRRGSRLARLYSIAVDPNARGRGVGRVLLNAAEQQAVERNCTGLRLEIRKDNAASIGLFNSSGYARIGEYPDYYEDGMDAWRYEKRLQAAPARDLPSPDT